MPEVTDGVENTNESTQTNQVEETTIKNSTGEEVKHITFDEILTDPEYKASYDKKVNDLLNKKQLEWGEKFEKSKAEEFESKTKELMQKAQLEAMNLRIENALLIKGIDASKSGRLKRLIDKTAVLDDKGILDADKLNTEIENVLNEFPELSKKSEENRGFVIGSDGNQETKKDELSDIRKIMGLS